MLQICGRADCHPCFNESCEKLCCEWEASSRNHIGEPGHPAFSLPMGASRVVMSWRNTFISAELAFTLMLFWELWSCGFSLFGDVWERSLASMSFCGVVCVGSTRRTQWLDLHESAGSCNCRLPMQNLPNLYWHRFKDEAPSFCWFEPGSAVCSLSENNRDTFVHRAVHVFSAGARGRRRLNHFPRGNQPLFPLSCG